MKRIKVYDSALVLLFGLVFSLNSTAWALHNGPVSYNDSGVCGEDVTPGGGWDPVHPGDRGHVRLL